MRLIFSRTTQRGFSFIELLVSTTILAIMIGIVVVNFQQANKAARDAKRRADMQEMRGILETVRLEEGEYPDNDNEQNGYEISSDGTFLENVDSTHLSKNYVDPLNQGLYYYRYRKRGLPGCQIEIAALLEIQGTGQTCAACGYVNTNYHCITD